MGLAMTVLTDTDPTHTHAHAWCVCVLCVPTVCGGAEVRLQRAGVFKRGMTEVALMVMGSEKSSSSPEFLRALALDFEES